MKTLTSFLLLLVFFALPGLLEARSRKPNYVYRPYMGRHHAKHQVGPVNLGHAKQGKNHYGRHKR